MHILDQGTHMATQRPKTKKTMRTGAAAKTGRGKKKAAPTPKKASAASRTKEVTSAAKRRASHAPAPINPAGVIASLPELEQQLREKQRELADALVMKTTDMRERHRKLVEKIAQRLDGHGFESVVDFLAMDDNDLRDHVVRSRIGDDAVRRRRRKGPAGEVEKLEDELREIEIQHAHAVALKLRELREEHDQLLVEMDTELAQYGFDSAYKFLAMDRAALREHMFRFVRGEVRMAPKRVRVIHAKYCHPETGERWAGRGMKPQWVREWERKHKGSLAGITIRYRHPDDPELVWVGPPAPKPLWVTRWLEDGGDLKELKVA